MNNNYKSFVFEWLNPNCEAEIMQAIGCEHVCFPPHEACSSEHMRMRIKQASPYFMVAKEKATKQIVAILNGICTNETKFRDSFFTDASLHQEQAENIMLTGLAVLPAYQNQGIAKAMMAFYAQAMRQKAKKALLLTCLASKVKMYEHFGFVDLGIANSTWGNEVWHEMIKTL